MPTKEICDSELKRKFQDYITEKFLRRDRSKVLGCDDSFLEKGIIDSTGVLELVNFIEETLNIKIEDEELIPANLDSLNKLVIFVQKKKKNASQ